MKKESSTDKSSNVSRRKFLATSAAATAGFTILPSTVIAGMGHKAPSDKLNIAGIGIGGKGAANIATMTTENIVALCDVDWNYSKKVFETYPDAKQYWDYRKMFDEMGKETEPEKSFEELLEESLTGESSQTLIKEKITASSDKTKLSKNTKLSNYPEPQDEIDLHGFKGDEAELKADFFIRDSKARGLVTIRIIVGKGTHSEGRAVLPDIVEGKIIDLKREGQIYTFKWEKGRKLKSGAVIIYLT